MKKEERFLDAIEQSKLIIYKAARVYTQTQEDQEDLIQEIIYQLWKSFDSFQGHSILSTWIYRVAMNTAMYHAQKNKKRVLFVEECRQTGSFAEGVISQLAVRTPHLAFDILGAADCFIPLGPAATAGLPSKESIVDKVLNFGERS